MATLNVTIKRVKLFEKDNVANVQLWFTESIDGITIGDDGEPVEGKVDAISVFRSQLTAQLCDANFDVALYRSTLSDPFNQHQLAVILMGAKLKLERTRVAKGEVVGDKTMERDAYITNIVDVTLSDRAKAQLEKATEL